MKKNIPLKLFINDFLEKGLLFHIARRHMPPVSEISPHTHDFYELFYIEEGQEQHTINGTVYNFNEGTLCLLGPSHTHFYTPSGNGLLKKINLAFSRQSLLEALLYLQFSADILHTATLLKINTDSDLRRIFMHAQRSLFSNLESTESRNRIFRSLLIQLLLELTQGLQAPSPVQKNGWLVQGLHTYRQKKLYTKGSHALAEVCGKSLEHISRVVKKTQGITLSSLINSMRIQEAMRMLTETDYPVLRISTESGFENLSHFNREFKKMCGLTPLQYRKKNLLILSGS
ncbi:MAG: hypothetical protein A2096_07810 [Spirochaetes bacterium GWF1_41_5]|nr:MAG: hypothetical protein A2096_07810 [Spirochaetes bacterium GWF1_41_5]HBE01677.1 hypothetical protein [Spirochaetia bacterium]